MADRTDTFDRSDSSTALGTPSDAGSDWVAGTGTWGVNANRGYCSSVTALALATLESSVANVEVQATIQTLSSVGGVVARYANTSNYLAAYLNSGVGATLAKWVGGSFTSLGTYAYTPANGDVIKLRCDGSSLTVYINGVSRITATDSAGSTNTKHGIRTHNDTGTRWDDFSITEIVSASTVVNPMTGRGGAAARPLAA